MVPAAQDHVEVVVIVAPPWLESQTRLRRRRPTRTRSCSGRTGMHRAVAGDVGACSDRSISLAFEVGRICRGPGRASPAARRDSSGLARRAVRAGRRRSAAGIAPDLDLVPIATARCTARSAGCCVAVVADLQPQLDCRRPSDAVRRLARAASRGPPRYDRRRNGPVQSPVVDPAAHQRACPRCGSCRRSASGNRSCCPAAPDRGGRHRRPAARTAPDTRSGNRYCRWSCRYHSRPPASCVCSTSRSSVMSELPLL